MEDQEQTLTNAMRAAGLKGELAYLCGSSFTFGDAEGHIIGGTIISVGYGPREGLSLRVSAPMFQGKTLLKIARNGDQWEAVVLGKNDLQPARIPGSLTVQSDQRR